MPTMLRTLGLCLLVALLVAPAAAQDDALNVVATTSIIADVAQNIMGDLGTVTSIIPTETDEHTFIPAPSDIITIAEAEVLLVNGGLLEEGLAEVIEENATVTPVVVSLGIEVLAGGHDHEHDEDHAEGEPQATEEAHEGEEHHHEHGGYEVVGILGEEGVCEDGHEHEEGEEHAEATEEAHAEGEDHEHGGCDPHFWTNPANVKLWAQNIAAALSAADPTNAETYAANAEAYIAELDALMAEIDMLLAELPLESRVIVTNHEFLAYFAVAYDFEVVGTVIPSVTTTAEIAPQDIITLVEIIEDEGVTAIFAETTASTAIAEIIAAEVGREITIATLYSGALSRPEGPAATYIDYMRYNVATIVGALTGNAG